MRIAPSIESHPNCVASTAVSGKQRGIYQQLEESHVLSSFPIFGISDSREEICASRNLASSTGGISVEKADAAFNSRGSGVSADKGNGSFNAHRMCSSKGDQKSSGARTPFRCLPARISLAGRKDSMATPLKDCRRGSTNPARSQAEEISARFVKSCSGLATTFDVGEHESCGSIRRGLSTLGETRARFALGATAEGSPP